MGRTRRRRIGKGLALVAAVLALFVAAACEADRWGPLAVIHEAAEVVIQVHGGEGDVEIGPDCVTLTNENRTITLVWRDSQTDWDGIPGQIVFHDVVRGDLRISDGDRIAVGGTRPKDDLDGVDGPDEIWVATPSLACRHELFVVHEVRRIP